jgi:putative transposase
MKASALLVKPNLRLKAKRTLARPKPRPNAPNQWWGIDMTKVMLPSFGWVYGVFVLDWYTKKIVGHFAGIQAKACHWLEALDVAVNQQFPDGARNHRVHLMSDNGCQPTSVNFMKACGLLGIQQALTSYNNPKGNADTERFMRTFKEELVWCHEWDNPIHFIRHVKRWVEDYNQNYCHSALGYQSPVHFEAKNLGDSLLVCA